MKKTAFFLIFLGLLFGFFDLVSADQEVELKFFYSRTCPHCAEERAFLEGEIAEKYPEIEIEKFSVSENIEFLKLLYKKYEVPREEQGLVPVLFIDNEYFLGFSEEIGNKIEKCIESKIKGEESCGPEEEDLDISLPLIGKINVSDYSLPALSAVLGFFDGFNVCSLGALVLILGLVLALRERKKMLLYGGIFIGTTALIYGLLIVVWHQIFTALASYLRSMEIIIGVLGVCGGVYFLREFIRFRKYGPTCQTQGTVSRINLKIKKILQEADSIIMVIGSLLVFAAAITIVEFPCSAAIPVFFAGILAEAQLPAALYLLYIAIFVLFYMLDEIIVFLIAFFTMTIKMASPKFVTWITLLEAMILLGLGLYYLFGI
jgi:glutaredoxin